jgi:hypothetical protein
LGCTSYRPPALINPAKLIIVVPLSFVCSLKKQHSIQWLSVNPNIIRIWHTFGEACSPQRLVDRSTERNQKWMSVLGWYIQMVSVPLFAPVRIGRGARGSGKSKIEEVLAMFLCYDTLAHESTSLEARSRQP